MDVGTKVRKRALNACEAMVDLPRARTRCGKSPVEDHHMLTRARGGDVLDLAGEIYHHLALCPWHHREAHMPGGFEKGLMMEGSAVINAGYIEYRGPDEHLSRIYAPRRLALHSLPAGSRVAGLEHEDVAREEDL